MPFAILLNDRPFLAGFGRRKKITLDSQHNIRDHIAVLTIYNTAGVDTVSLVASSVYLDGNVRADWGDLRLTKNDGLTCLPYAILREEATYITIQFKLPACKADTVSIYLYYDGPAANVYKMGFITDQHYDAGTNYADRDLSTDFIDNFVARMATYLPDLAVSNGDKTGASSAVEATQLGWYQAVLDAFAAVSGSATVVRDGVAPGNHDFEYMSFASVLAKHAGETWMEPGVMYGEWESADFHFISLDSNYAPSTDTHMSLTHQGYGYINPAQIAWLRTALAAATKDVIVFCHHPLSEMDTDQFTLTKETYHTQNRELIRHILEQSGKVIACFHGHVHFSRIDCIRGIPYITCGNLTNDASNNPALGFGELPASSEGRWDLIEFDRSSRMIRVKHEVQVASAYYTVYDSVVPFGPSTISDDVSNNPEKVFSFNYDGAFEKSCFLRDATQLYVTDDDYVRKFPVNFHTPDPFAYRNAIRIQGRTNNPNFGRLNWVFDTQGDRFCFQGSFYFPSAVSTKGIKFGWVDIINSPAVYLAFTSGGNIQISNGIGILTTLQAYVPDTRYDIQMFISLETNLVSLIINGVGYDNAANGYWFYSANENYKIRQMEIVTETGDMFIHNFRIRPWTINFYNNPEVSVIGAEETP
jgi:hypothetical protein